ncbi:MAG: DUF2277 domain-containing protein [Bermanella sp.]
MCRNIKPLFNFEPPASREEIHASALQFVRKVSGGTHPAKINEEAFAKAVKAVEEATALLLSTLVSHAPSKNREEELLKKKIKNEKRFSLTQIQ